MTGIPQPLLSLDSYWTRRVGRRRFLGALGASAAAAAIAAACTGEPAAQTRATPTAPPAPSPRPPRGATPAPTGAAPHRGGTLTVAMARDLNTLDPARNPGVYSATVLALVAESLFEYDPQANVAPRVVERSEHPQPNVYLWSLRKGITFADGTELNAEAVKFNLRRQIDDPGSAAHRDVQDIVSIETPDAATVQVTLKAPFAPFLDRMVGGAGTMLSPAAVQALGDNLQHDLTGATAGAFVLAQWQRDAQIVLERNRRYWRTDAGGGALPYLDRVVLQVVADESARLARVETGECDVLHGNPPAGEVGRLTQRGDLAYEEMPGLGWSFMALNTAREPFTRPSVRRAVSLAIDRAAILQAVNFGVGIARDTPVPDAIRWAYERDTHPYLRRDVERARHELAAAGAGGGLAFTVQVSSAAPLIRQQAELIRAQLREAGIEMEIEPVDFGTLVRNANRGEYQASMLNWSGGADPDDNLYPFFHSGADFNFARYGNPQLDALLDEGRTTLDQATRGEIYKQAQQILFDDQPLVVYQHGVQGMLTRRTVRNYPRSYNGYWGARDYDRVFKRT